MEISMKIIALLVMATLELSDLVGESSSSLWKKLDDEESKLLLLGGIIVSF